MGRHFVLPKPFCKVVQKHLWIVGRVIQSAAMGALPTLRAATDPTAEGGQYYGPDGFMETRGHPEVVTSSGRSHELETQQHLWEASEELTGVTYPV